MMVMAITAISASAEVEEGFAMGVRADVGIGTLTGGGCGVGFSYGIGWIAEYNFASNLYLQSGVGLQNLAHTEDFIEGTLNAFYAQVPIHVGYRFPVGDTTSLFVQAGPTLGVGIFGSKIRYTYPMEDFLFDYNYFDYARRFDLGVGARVGVEINSFQISAATNFGVLPIAEGNSSHNLCATIGVAYMF